MYNNIGDKIKGLAMFFAIAGIIGSIVAGIIMCTQNAVAFGLLIIVCGSIISWVSSFVLYGFGQLVENSDILASQIIKNNEKKQQIENKKQVQHIANQIQDNQVDSSVYIDFQCPLCGETLTYTKGEIRSNQVLDCPMCNQKFYTKDIFGI